MTDKELKDWCKTCDVEPPAMKFKCPECEHNTDNENIFAKDINVPRKEQIIIDGVNIIGTIDEWARLVAHEWGTDEYSDEEIVKNYILDINKQLARKTQECESLKEEIEILKDNFDTATRDCNELIEELRQECEELKGKYKNVLDLAKQNADANEYCLQELEQENYRYRKALEEIEEICKNGVYDEFNMPLDECDFILDIINKAKGKE